MLPLEGNVALVTNVNHFVGLASALSLAETGAKVICHDKSFSSQEKREKFESTNPALLTSSEQNPSQLINNLIESYGTINILVSNDFFPAIRGKIEDCSLSDLRDGFESLVVKPFEIIAAVVPIMKKQNQGKIILVTSAAPIRGLANYSMYATARGAANSLTKSLSRELASKNIQVNAVAPNYIESPSYFPPELLANDSAKQKIVNNIPLGRLGKPREVSSVVNMLSSPGGDFITGQVISIDGGWS